MQHWEKKALKITPLHSVPPVGFPIFLFFFSQDFLFFFVLLLLFYFYTFHRLIIGVDWQCPGPITWQSDSVKTLELQWGYFWGVTGGGRLSAALSPVDSARHQTGPLTDTSWGACVSSLLGEQRQQSYTEREKKTRVWVVVDRKHHKRLFNYGCRCIRIQKTLFLLLFFFFKCIATSRPFIQTFFTASTHGHLRPVGLCGYRWILSGLLLCCLWRIWQREFLQRHRTLLAEHTHRYIQLAISPVCGVALCSLCSVADLWPPCRGNRLFWAKSTKHHIQDGYQSVHILIYYAHSWEGIISLGEKSTAAFTEQQKWQSVTLWTCKYQLKFVPENLPVRTWLRKATEWIQ